MVEATKEVELVCDTEEVLLLSVVVVVDTDDEEDRVSLAPQTPLLTTEAPKVDFR